MCALHSSCRYPRDYLLSVDFSLEEDFYLCCVLKLSRISTKIMLKNFLYGFYF